MDLTDENKDEAFAALELRIANLETRESALIYEKNKMVEDFNAQRAKLKEMYLQKEDELRQGVVGSSELIDELEEMKLKVKSLEGELKNFGNFQYESDYKNYCSFTSSALESNDNFLKVQRECLSNIQRLKSFLTKEQMSKFHESKGIDGIPLTQFHVEIKKNDQSEKYLESTGEDTEKTQERKEESLNLLDFEEARQREDRINSVEASSQFIPDDMPQLTDDQKRALSGLYTSGTNRESGDSSCSTNELEESTTSPIFVSRQEWNNLNHQFEKCFSTIMEPCRSCTDMEVALKKTETELCKMRNVCDVLNKAAERQIEDLKKETLYRKKCENKWLEMVQDFQGKEKLLHTQLEAVTSNYSEAINQSKYRLNNYEQQLKKLTDKRECVNKELMRLQHENEKLVGKYSDHSQEMQNEIINLPDSVEEMHLLLLKYREDVIAAKVAKESLEETLSSRILFLKDQLLSEQHEKSLMEDKLSNEVVQLRNKLRTFEEHQRTIELEKSIRIELEAQIRDREQNLADVTEKYRLKFLRLKEQLEEFSHVKMQQNHETIELKNRVSTLQHDLETSEGVQRDFVRLSQSLQVQLERIRQSEKEVRWQHEEDVEECTSCKQKFTAVGRRKHYCRHCGKIFCSECCSHGVPSGPNRRISKVCDVCHTLLVADATPFFSTDTPNSIN